MPQKSILGKRTNRFLNNSELDHDTRTFTNEVKKASIGLYHILKNDTAKTVLNEDCWKLSDEND